MGKGPLNGFWSLAYNGRVMHFWQIHRKKEDSPWGRSRTLCGAWLLVAMETWEPSVYCKACDKRHALLKQQMNVEEGVL